jgi:hypothetical protein
MMEPWQEQKQKLETMSEYVHNILKRLKMGETATVPLGKMYKMDEMRWYIIAYSKHKEKRFDLTEDRATNSIIATRVSAELETLKKDHSDGEEL